MCANNCGRFRYVLVHAVLTLTHSLTHSNLQLQGPRKRSRANDQELRGDLDQLVKRRRREPTDGEGLEDDEDVEELQHRVDEGAFDVASGSTMVLEHQQAALPCESGELDQRPVYHELSGWNQ